MGHSFFVNGTPPAPDPPSWESPKPTDLEFQWAADSLSDGLSIELEKDDGDDPTLLGEGAYGRIYAVSGGAEALKVTAEGGIGFEEILAQNIPKTPTLLRVKGVAEASNDAWNFTGQLMDRVYSQSCTYSRVKSTPAQTSQSPAWCPAGTRSDRTTRSLQARSFFVIFGGGSRRR